jgi:hypothetical protein
MCLLSAVCLFIAGITYWQKTSCYENYVTIINKTGSYEEEFCNLIDEKQETLEIEKIMNFTFWGEEADVLISDKENLRQTRTTLLTIRGSSEHLIPYGKILQKEDKKGCLIGKKTAEKLFGTHRAENLYVQYENQMFQVRGILNEPEDILVIQKQSTIDAILNGITIKRKSHSTVPETVENFCVTYGVNGEALRFDFYRGFSWLLELIPGKWSDFSGWKQNISAVKKEWELLESSEKSMSELNFLRHTKKAIGCFAFACVGLGGCIVIFRHNSKENT